MIRYYRHDSGVGTMLTMARPRKPDQHKTKPFTFRLHPALRKQLDLLADRNASSVTTEATIAIRIHLEAAGLWPPPEKPKSPPRS